MNFNKVRSIADLKIDIDTHKKNQIKIFNFRYKWLAFYMMQHQIRILPAKIKVWRTKKGFHFYVYFIDVNTSAKVRANSNRIITVFMQSILGSDWLRELRNFDRILKNEKNWNLLFENKIKKNKPRHESFVASYTLMKGIFDNKIKY